MNVGIYFGKKLPIPEEGGASSFSQTIFEALSKYSWAQNISLYVFYESEDHLESYNSAVKFVSLKKFNEPKKLTFYKRIKIKLRKLLNSKTNQSDTEYKQSSLSLACDAYNIHLMWFPTPAFIKTDIPYFITVWDLAHRKLSYFPEVSVSGTTFEAREQHYIQSLQKATLIIVGNKIGMEEVEFFYRIPRTRIAPIEFPVPAYCQSIQLELPIAKSNLSFSQPYLFYPAQFWPHKNHIIIIEAISKLKQQGLLFEAVFTGADKGNLDYVKTYAEKLNVKDKIHFLGFVEQKKLIDLYQHAYALIFASFFGPNNLPPLEAFSLECPVICANYDGAIEQLGDAALYFSPYQVDELIFQIIKLQEPYIRMELIEKGKKIAQLRHSASYIKAIEDMIINFEYIRKTWSMEKKYIHL
ncbi:glycosyltransferase family 4 protein [Candidatus Dependentiae bacterium]|nr:glycosyltransferase family 4 protein [Candidatus Dependentiae bacterium]